MSIINTEVKEKLEKIFRDHVLQKSCNRINNSIEVMVYPSTKAISTRLLVNVKDVIQEIKEGEDRQCVKKKLLPAVYFSVANFNGNKENVNVTKHSGLIVFDIDLKDNPDADFDELKLALQKELYTYACFTSPNGGIKLIVNTNIQRVEDHHAYYISIKDFLLKNYKQIVKIDKSGCNVARACYMPYDRNAFINTGALLFCLNEQEITEINSQLNHKQNSANPLKVLHQVDSITFDEHYDNILNLLKKRTSVGLYDENDSEKRTTMGLYDNVFNKYRYNNIDKSIMRTDVPFLELLILQHIYPYRLDLTTTIDEYYFTSNPQKQIHTHSIGFDGLEICEVILPMTKIKEHYRAKTLGSMSIKLIFNNPFCHPDFIVRAVQRINDYFCEDPHPDTNPKPTDEEVTNIVMNNYKKFINGELDFSGVIRKNPKTNVISKKYVFRSKQYMSIDKAITQLEAIRTYSEGKHEQNLQKCLEAINYLQDGKKITQKRIAAYMGVSERNLRRNFPKEYTALIKKYNEKLK